MRRFGLVLISLAALSNCTMTAQQLKHDVGALVVKPSLSGQRTASMVGDGFEQCLKIDPSIHQAGDGTWITLADVGGPQSPGPLIVVESTDERAIVAPRWSSAGGAMAGMVAEWIERGQVTRCERTDADRARWDAEARKL